MNPVRFARRSADRVARFALARAARIPRLQRPAFAAYGRLFPEQAWKGTHPFDRQFGTDTSGFVPQWLLQPGVAEAERGNPYAGCQPRCLRAALDSLPDLSRFSFLDLGCGKGRAMVVASEYPFRAVLGVDLAPGLVQVARRNAATVARAWPGRVRLHPMVGNVTEVGLPDGNLVVFNYHAFPRSLVGQIVARLAAAAAPGREIFFVYENPVCFDIADGRRGFRRWFAARVACAEEERGCSAEDDDSVVVWRAGGPDRQPRPGADAAIAVTKPDWRAEVQPSSPPILEAAHGAPT